MKRNILNRLLFAYCLLAMVSCKAKKIAVANNNAPVKIPTQTKPAPVAVAAPSGKNAGETAAIKAAQLNFNTFSGKANAKLTLDGSSNDVVLTIRIEHNKRIWVSVAATILNIEGARALITPDSISIMDKLHGQYLKKPFSYLYKYANDQVNYGMLEALLVGNAAPDILNDKNMSVLLDNGNVILSGTLQDLVYKLVTGIDNKPINLNLSDHNEGQSLEVANSALIPAGNGSVPSQIDIHSTAQSKKVQLNLHYTKADLDQPLQYPFNIPANYTPEQ